MKKLITICIEKNENTNNSTITNLRASLVVGLVLLIMLAGALDVVAAPNIITHFPIPGSSSEFVAVNPSLNKIYVSGGAAGGQNVTVIDGSTFAQTTVGTGSGVSVDTVNNQYWAGTVYGGSAIVRDGVTNGTVTNIGLGYCPYEADVDSAHRRVWVGAQCGGDMVWAIDADTFATIAGPINTGGTLGPILVNSATGRLYVYPSGVSKRVDPTTFAVTANTFGQVVGVNPVTNRLYVYSGATLQIIDGAPDPELILASVPISFTPNAGYNIGVNTALNRIYIGCSADNTLYTIDGTTGTELGSALLGSGVSIGRTAVDSTNNRIYVMAYTASGPELFVLQDYCQYVLAGDLNDDCRVDFFDFAAMAANWLVDCDLTPGDPACLPK
jgi:DNA-binding beta-propeller fold protein YncE